MRKLSRRGWLALALALAGVASAILVGTVLAAGSTFTVNSTGDAPDANRADGVCQTSTSDQCTLRAAIQQANNTSTNGGPDTIKFNIVGPGVQTITPDSPLPIITDPVTIDGYSQGDGTADDATPNTLAVGNNARLLIELNGVNATEPAPPDVRPDPPVGLWLSGGSVGSTVRGLVINRFEQEGIRITQANSVVEGNFIGTDASGTLPRGNFLDGVFINQSGNTLGGTTPAARNVISANGGASSVGGVSITGGGNTVQGNYIGTDKNGTAPLGNSSSGVILSDRDGNTVGGTSEGARNVISGNNGPGITIRSSDGNQVQGNYIGTKANGTEPLGNSSDGVHIDSGGTNNTIGGATPGARNVISGNTNSGVFIGSSGNQVQGNYVGTDKDGTAPLGNNFRGVVLLNTANNTIGGTAEGEGNVISANNISGVYIEGSGSTGSQVQGNYVGTGKDGTRLAGAPDLGNNGPGVDLDTGSSNNTIGGTVAGARNVISDNQGIGVFISSSGNQVQGNYVGTDKDGARPAGAPDLGNSFDGVNVGSQGANNTIGGATTAARNVISDNGFNGIGISGSSNQVQGNYIGTDASGAADLGNSFDGVSVSGINNSILSNSIFANGGASPTNLGIDLAPDGVTPNDPQDQDFGANNLQNFPVINSAEKDIAGTTIKGRFNSTPPPPNTTFTVQFFSSPQADPSGYGEGKTFLGETNATTDANGDASFAFTTAGAVSVSDFVTATATNQTTKDTSEFSAAKRVNTPPQIDAVTNSGQVEEGKPAMITVAATDPDNGTLTYEFDCDNNGTYEIGPQPDNTAQCTFADDGDYTVNVRVTDQDGGFAIGSTTVTVTNANPKINDVSADPTSIDEGSSSTIKVDADDPAGSNDKLTYEFDCNGNGAFGDTGVDVGPQSEKAAQCTFPDDGTFTVNVLVTDEDGGKGDIRSTTVDVNNVAPTVTLSGPSTANEGDTKPYTFTVTDPGDDTQTVTTGCGAKGEKVAGSDTYDQASGSGSFQCRFPDGPATSDVTVKATDSDGASDTDDRRVTVTVVNAAPQAEDQSVQTNEDEATTITLKGSDRGEDDSLTFEITDQPDDGALGPVGTPTCTGTTNRTCSANVTYTPKANFNGTDSFKFRVNDGTDNSAEAIVSITVNAANDAPDAKDDGPLTTMEDTPVDIPVLNNDSDPENDTLTIASKTNPTHGTVSCTNTSCTYTPGANYNGPDSFTYTISDGHGGTDTATVNIAVSAANGAPTADSQSVTTDEDQQKTITLRGSDPEGGALTFRITDQPDHGSLSSIGTATCDTTTTTKTCTASVTYTPTPDYNGPDSFKFLANDGTEDGNEAGVSLTVNPVDEQVSPPPPNQVSPAPPNQVSPAPPNKDTKKHKKKHHKKHHKKHKGGKHKGKGGKGGISQ